jgi:hypothetical protein
MAGFKEAGFFGFGACSLPSHGKTAYAQTFKPRRLLIA